MEPAPKRLCINEVITISDNSSNGTDISNDKKESDDSESQSFNTLQDIEITKVLNNSDKNCSIIIQGKIKDSSEKAIIILKKLPFNEEKLSEIFTSQTSLKTLFINDIYYNKVASIPAHLNEISANIIYPADEKHIKKYEKHLSLFIAETPELYTKVTLPSILESSYSKDWIYNILEHKQEADRIVCEDTDPDTGFVLVPDMKWTGEQVEDLYLQALIMRRDIMSIRDLTSDHLPLLTNVYDRCTEAIKEKYGLSKSNLRVYFHYQPSFYHLHIHFSALSFEAPGIWLGKAHAMQDVISNLRIDSDYYKKATLSFTIKENHPMVEKYKEYGYFEEKDESIQ